MSLKVKMDISQGAFRLAVDISLPARGVTALYGPSGSGKTTLLRALAGLDRQANAEIMFNDEAWQDKSHFVPTHKRAIAFVFQEDNLLPHLSVLDNLNYVIRRLPSDKKSSLSEFVAELGLHSLLKKMPMQLSGGERQRVAVALALVGKPNLVLMDEPLASLDKVRKREIRSYIEQLSKKSKVPVLYVTHSVAEVARLANHLVLIDEGKITHSGAIDELLTQLSLPMARREFASAVLYAKVKSYDQQYDISCLEFNGGSILVAGNYLPVGNAVRVGVAARDVSIALQKPQKISVLNCLEARINDLQKDGDAQLMLRLQIGDSFLLARVTCKSADQLQLKCGMSVFALVKSVAILT